MSNQDDKKSVSQFEVERPPTEQPAKGIRIVPVVVRRWPKLEQSYNMPTKAPTKNPAPVCDVLPKQI
jgi:hypothetical protein